MVKQEDYSELIREETSELLGEMESALLELENQPDDRALVNRVFRAMHTVKGAANMFGFKDIAALTHEVETVFDRVRNGKLSAGKTLLDLGLQAKDIIWRLVDSPDDVDMTAYKALLEAMAAIGEGEPPESFSELAAPKAALLEEEQSAELAEPPSAPQQETEEPEPPRAQQRPAAFHVSVKPTADDFCLHVDVLDVLEDLRGVGECVITPALADVPELDTLVGGRCAISWDALIRAQDADEGRNAIMDALMFVEGKCDVSITEVEDEDAWMKEFGTTTVPEAFHTAPEQPESPPTAPEPETIRPAPTPVEAKEPAPSAPLKDIPSVTKQAPSTPPVAPAPKSDSPKAKGKPAKARKKEPASSIRVDAFKLDDMVALVGELVIAQARLSQIVSGYSDPSLQSVAEELELLSGSLRDRTLSMRMLPIGTTFDRFRRLVRDLSRELSKEIELITEGADTELDKTVIEQLGDPLVHLLRNSIDHGIESPEERTAVGKERKGRIILSAQHSGGNVLIKIIDDGKGLDRDVIAAKGVERGLIADAVGMSDKEVFSLIFQPGFSTAQTVTNVSGRGVGMDVVKKSIDALRGRVELESVKGQGATVTVKLPLTLAIIEGLQVRVGDEYFVIPLAAVQECVELTPEERGEYGDNGSNKRIINLRNEIVPYVCLREWFEIPGEKPELEQIIIASDGDRRTGIVVDEVIGQQQTVIKTLGRVFRDVHEISGATIKGDGTMALILDIPYLVRTVMAEEQSRN